MEMYKIEQQEFTTLADAMTHAKTLDAFVVIQGKDFEICGRFGVDAVSNGVCPDGIAYDWNKADRIGRVKKKKQV